MPVLLDGGGPARRRRSGRPRPGTSTPRTGLGNTWNSPRRSPRPEIPPADKLVVCHGDACAPNTLITDDGRWSGHVDLGDLGVADRWADLAIATWSTGWNYGPGWEQVLLDAYGIKPDEERTSYYRLLWELG